jgi:protein-tyrosine phosphatase
MKILFVCLGNICRSPLAEGIMLHKVKQKKLNVVVDSAGTGGWHAGENPDSRAISVAKRFGVDISTLVARQFRYTDFELFDKIFVMDRSNLRDVSILATKESDLQKVDLFLNLTYPGKNLEVPDPWYGGVDGFTEVFKMINNACNVLIETIENNNW